MRTNRMIAISLAIGVSVMTTGCGDTGDTHTDALSEATWSEASQNASSDEDGTNTEEASISDAELHQLKQEMLSMEVPAVCGHDAGRLVNGYLPGRIGGGTWVGDGLAWQDSDEQPDPETIKALPGDLDGQPGDEIALELNCYQGGVGWPPMVAVLDRDLNFIDVLENFPPEIRLSRAEFSPFTIEDGAIIVGYSALADGDVEASPSLRGTSEIKLIDGQLQVTSSSVE